MAFTNQGTFGKTESEILPNHYIHPGYYEMRTHRRSAGIIRRGFSRVYFSPIFLRLWQLLITVS